MVDATKSIAKDEDRAVFDETKKMALVELEKRIPEINKIINEFKFQIYWAGKVLNGFNGPTPFGDSQKALVFLRENLGIDKNGVDKPQGDGEKEPKKEDGGGGEAGEMSFEDKLERVKNTGGTLVEAYKKYIFEGIKPEKLDYVLSQVKQAFPFDVVEFVREWKEKSTLEANEKKDLRMDKTDKEKNRVVSENLLIRLSGLPEGGDGWAETLDQLESTGIKARDFLKKIDGVKPGRTSDVLSQMRVVVEFWRMSVAEKDKYPEVAKVAKAYSSLLGL